VHARVVYLRGLAKQLATVNSRFGSTVGSSKRKFPPSDKTLTVPTRLSLSAFPNTTRKAAELETNSDGIRSSAPRWESRLGLQERPGTLTEGGAET
jgi:hypothetical protein